MPAQPLPPSRFSVRVFSALLRLYPRPFRDEYGREMTLVFADRHRDAAGSGQRLRLWLETVIGVLTEAPREHVRITTDDLRHASRRLRRSAGFVAIAVPSLALAIGASTAAFGVLHGVVLRPLPYTTPDRLAMLWTEMPGQGVREGRSSYANVELWRSARSVEQVAAFDPASATLTIDGERQQISVTRATPRLFALLGIQLARGRTFSEQEAQSRDPVAVISHRFWQDRFGGGPHAIGAVLDLDGRRTRVIGILPEASQMPGFDADLWEPHTLSPAGAGNGTVFGPGAWFVVARLQPSTTLEQAQAELTAITRGRDNRQLAAAQSLGVRVQAMHRYITGTDIPQVLWLLTAAALCLLLVASSNVAGLSLARSVDRVPEMAICGALGASRARLARQLFAEGVVLTAAAVLLGLLLALGAIRLVHAFGPAGVPRLEEVTPSLTLLGWLIGVSVVTVALVGLAPLATLWRHDIQPSLVSGGRGVVSGRATRLRRVFVMAECAVAVLLLSTTGLLLRSWWNVLHVDLGFEPAQVITANVAAPVSAGDDDRIAFYRRVLDEISPVTGVERAAVASELFVTSAAELIITPGAGSRPQRFRLRSDEVTADFFNALGTPLLRGRVFSEDDVRSAPRVAVVNDAFARRVWGEDDPVGSRFTFGVPRPESAWFTVIGVVGNMRRQGYEEEPVPQVFQAISQNPPGRALLVARASPGDPSRLASAMRAAVARVDSRALVYGVSTVSDRLDGYLSRRRIQTLALAGFALVTLLLAAIGVYAVLQYSVAARTQEIGIRMALGATAADVFRQFVGEGVVLALAGNACGLLGAIWTGRYIAGLLFGVTAADPATLMAVSVLLVVVTAAACYGPARRAMRVAPIMALRQYR